MSRRDTILVAVLMNTGLLAILFMMAVSKNEEVVLQQKTTNIASEPAPLSMTANTREIAMVKDPHPRMEQIPVLPRESSLLPSTPHLVEEDETDQLLAEDTKKRLTEPAPLKEKKEEEMQFVEVTVKRGDALSTIARSNATTVSAIKKANHLKNERIDVGQVLQIPVGGAQAAQGVRKSSKDAPEIEIAKSEPQYYTIQSGDNPWKLAKKFHVKFEDLLKMNKLNEEKARNLKPGDQIRVR